ncbi:distal tail protein [Escherichia phage vB_EcoS_ESCO30]|uniref:Distal tail protein n=1 Tax=Escherichia phage vB_EcoS_ESCO30 TaxID=2918879 RepID=A0AAE9HPF5_9CAUD|nr:distal tail protein [Escherichia phage vB_EcoS_ESCO30]
MRLPDPYTNPELSGLGFESVNLIDNDPVIRDELPNGKVNEVKVSAQYWGINISYPELFPDEYSVLDAFILEYKRTGSYIDVILPQYEAFRVRGNTSLVNIPAGQKGSNITMDTKGLLTGIPKPGDLFKLSNHPKVYKITSFNKSGNTWSINLYPDLFITTTGAEKPVFNGILFRTKLMNGDAFGSTLNNNGTYSGISLNLRESL